MVMVVAGTCRILRPGQWALIALSGSKSLTCHRKTTLTISYNYCPLQTGITAKDCCKLGWSHLREFYSPLRRMFPYNSFLFKTEGIYTHFLIYTFYHVLSDNQTVGKVQNSVPINAILRGGWGAGFGHYRAFTSSLRIAIGLKG